MPMIAVQLTIGDYAKWRPVFDRHKPLRDKAGAKNTRVYRDADDSKEVLVWSETLDFAQTREALASEEVRKVMREAGVIGPPRVHVIP
jgi:hypothetical protein